jgi:electron transfer flavoprotein beta subunit
MAAKRKPIPVISLADLAMPEEQLKPQLEMVSLDSPPPREAGKIIQADPVDAARQLVEFLHSRAKVL